MQPDHEGRPVLTAAHRQRAQIGFLGHRECGHRLGQRIPADQFEIDHPGDAAAHPAHVHPEPVGQALGPVGEVGRGLTGHQANRHPVGTRGGRHPAEHRQHDLAAVHRGQPGDRHHRPPVPPVEPPPPAAAQRHCDEPGEPVRPPDPQCQERGDGHVGQDHHAGPSRLGPREDDQARRRV
ncbi:MAG TPA: hypothetical protein VMV92_40770 [Streptosporangiaceae bacterium]|nr:hypothetical protein [Streptosporangiaceae bacterium]